MLFFVRFGVFRLLPVWAKIHCAARLQFVLSIEQNAGTCVRTWETGIYCNLLALRLLLRLTITIAVATKTTTAVAAAAASQAASNANYCKYTISNGKNLKQS